MIATALAATPALPARNNDSGTLHALAVFDLTVALISADFRLLERAGPSNQIFDTIFRTVRDRIVFCSASMRSRFEAVVDRAAEGGRLGSEIWVSDVFTQSRPNSMPLLVRILAAPRVDDVAALVVLFDLERDRHVPEHLLRSAFGLTTAEAALAANLTNGRTLREICDHSKVRISTLRSQLAGVLAKTGTSRQAHLVSLLAKVSVSGPADSIGR